MIDYRTQKRSANTTINSITIERGAARSKAVKEVISCHHLDILRARRDAIERQNSRDRLDHSGALTRSLMAACGEMCADGRVEFTRRNQPAESAWLFYIVVVAPA